MRITGGAQRGRRLKTPRGLAVRPTADRVREALFSILGQDLSSLRILDLFAGTGACGLEALSRGACYGLFVDQSPEALALLRENILRCRVQERATVLAWDLRRGLPLKALNRHRDFSLVFLDPPYGGGLLQSLLVDTHLDALLSRDGVIVAESRKDESLPERLEGRVVCDARLYGDTRITIYKREEKLWAAT